MAFNPPTEEALLDLVGQIYDAAIEPAKWPLVLEHLAAVIGGTYGGDCGALVQPPEILAEGQLERARRVREGDA